MKNKFDTFKEKLMTDIESGALSPKPRWKEIGYSVLASFLIAVIFILTVSVFVYLFHALRAAGISALLGFGWRGIILFLVLTPWGLIAIDILFVMLLMRVAKRFEIIWKVPRLYLAAFFLAAAFTAGAIFDRPINDRLVEMDRYERPLPPQVGAGFTHGTIITLEATECILSIVDERTGDTIEVWVLQPTCAQLVRFQIGESVIIAGEDDGGILNAFGIEHDKRPLRR